MKKVYTNRQLQEEFGGVHVELEWIRQDLIDKSPQLALKLAAGANVTEAPRGQEKYVSIVLEGEEVVVHRTNYLNAVKLVKAMDSQLLTRFGYPRTTTTGDLKAFANRLYGSVRFVLECLNYLKSQARNIFDIDNSVARLFWCIPDAGSCGLYRSQHPDMYLRGLMRQEEGEAIDDTFKGIFSEGANFMNYHALTFYDALFYNRSPDSKVLGLLQNLKSEGKVMVYETDDDLVNVPDWNYYHKFLNDESKSRVITSIAMADIIHTTNENLQCKLQKMAPDTPVMITPNLIDLNFINRQRPFEEKALDSRLVGLKPEREGKEVVYTKKGVVRTADQLFKGNIEKNYNPIVIMWAGSNTHDKDCEVLVEPIKMIGQEFGIAVKFVFCAYIPTEFVDVQVDAGNTNPAFVVKDKFSYFIDYIPGVPLSQYPGLIHQVNPDFALCPLTPHEFNLSKSNLKPLELGAMGVPSIVSDYGEYKFIRDQVDGLKVGQKTEDWVSAIKQMIVYQGKRNDMAKAIYDRVKSEYSWQNDSEQRRKWDRFFVTVKQICDSTRDKRHEHGVYK